MPSELSIALTTVALFCLLVGIIAIVRLRGGARARDANAPGRSQRLAPDEDLGSKIERIKKYRAQHGVSLKEAKDAVEAGLDAGAGDRTELRTVSGARNATPSVEALVQANDLIAAIKLYRAQHGCGLKEAKEAVERLRDA